MSTQPPVRDRASTLRNTPAVSVTTGQFGLLTIVNGVVTTHVLPETGSVTIGRARESDIQVIDPSVSRVHARIKLTYPMTIEDLASANGTFVRGNMLDANTPVPLPLGESMEMGGATVMVQQRPIATREWRIWAHGYFEGRLEEEAVRAARAGGSFGLLRVNTATATGGSEVAQQVLASLLRQDDVVGLYGPDEYEVLLVDRDGDAAQALADELRLALQDVGLEAKTGLAVFPQDGRTGDKLATIAGTRARGAAEVEAKPDEIIVKSQAMQKLIALVERVAHGDISVLILGETGVGKEIMAERVHNASPRAGRPFLRLNCAALTESLLESELFGHERGAFTGATNVKAGLLETAQGGSVFLDEIGELPLTTQVKLLRVLEERQVWRVGAIKPRSIDVRFIAATNRDLEECVSAGSFRQDLYFRLNGVALSIPPLRERREEICELAQTFATEVAGRLGRPTPRMTPEAEELLSNYAWPGNIRELRNAVERAVLLSENEEVAPQHFAVEKMSATVSTPVSQHPPASRDAEPTNPRTPLHSERPPSAVENSNTLTPPPMSPEAPTSESLADRLRKQVREVERQHIIDALARCGGNQTRAAKELGISRRTLISRLETYDIPRPLKDRR